MIQIKCINVSFHSESDELVFFEWLKKIKAIKDFRGELNYLTLSFRSGKISDSGLREILALFYRYKINMKELKQFLNEDNKSWFQGNTKAFWYKGVFGKGRL